MLQQLSDFLDARPGLTLSLRSDNGVVRILATRLGERRFLHCVEADPMDGDLTRPLNEIAEALEEHDHYASKSRRFAAV